MSDGDPSNEQDRPPGPSSVAPPRRHGCLTALMVVCGVILLLPGLCALLFSGFSLTQSHLEAGFAPFILVGLLVGFFGIMLIWTAIRPPRS